MKIKDQLNIKVLIAGSYPLPGNDPNGGAEEVTYNLARNLSERQGIRIELLSRNDRLKHDFELEEDNLKIHYFAKRRPKIVSSLVRDLPDLRSKISEINPDIVHAQLLDSAYAGIKSGHPTLLTLHGIVWKEGKFYPGLKGVGRRLVYPRLARNVLNRLNHLVLISPYVLDEVRDLTRAKTYLVENPIKEEFFKIESKEEEGRVFYLGFIRRRKNILNLIKAVNILKERFSDFELVLGGKPDDDSYFRLLQSYVYDNDLNSNVKFLGYIDKQQIFKEFSRMSIFCLPSYQETAPMVISEAMASGKPVIASNVCGLPYMIEEGKTGYLIDPDDIEEIADKIQKLLKDKELRIKMGQKARAEAKKRWHPRVTAAKTYEVYKSILNK